MRKKVALIGGGNIGGVLLSGAMMFEHLDWDYVSHAIIRGFEGAIRAGHVTYDLARQTVGATEVSTSAFADKIIENMT